MVSSSRPTADARLSDRDSSLLSCDVFLLFVHPILGSSDTQGVRISLQGTCLLGFNGLESSKFTLKRNGSREALEARPLQAFWRKRRLLFRSIMAIKVVFVMTMILLFLLWMAVAVASGRDCMAKQMDLHRTVVNI